MFASLGQPWTLRPNDLWGSILVMTVSSQALLIHMTDMNVLTTDAHDTIG